MSTGLDSSTGPVVDTRAFRDVSGHFCSGVTVVTASDRFAKSGGPKFDGVQWRPAARGAPILDGVAAWFEVALAVEHDGGDHLIAVADLLDFGSDPAAQPLLFHRSRYGGIVELRLGSIESGT